MAILVSVFIGFILGALAIVVLGLYIMRQDNDEELKEDKEEIEDDGINDYNLSSTKYSFRNLSFENCPVCKRPHAVHIENGIKTCLYCHNSWEV